MTEKFQDIPWGVSVSEPVDFRLVQLTSTDLVPTALLSTESEEIHRIGRNSETIKFKRENEKST